MKRAPLKKANPALAVAFSPPGRTASVLLFSLTFLFSFIIYYLCLAPSVTFEDSGELITAAFSGGVPHEPGYPLFSMLGRLFSLLPFGNVAHRLNLMSAFFSALGVGVISLVVLELLWTVGSFLKSIQKLSGDLRISVLCAVAFAAAILAGMGSSYFEQAVITEVYGINDLFAALFFLLLLKWYVRKRDIYFYSYCFLCGLSSTNHHTSLVFIPLGFLFVFMIDRKWLFDFKRMGPGLGLLLIGLLPYLYLPLAAGRNPDMNWGDPENWTNFWRVIGRHQYSFDQPRTAKLLVAQLQMHWRLLYEEFSLVPLILAGVGMLALFRLRRNLFYFSLLVYLFTGPVVAYVLNFNLLRARTVDLMEEMKGTISVFYLSLYLYVAGLVALGCLFIAEGMAGKLQERPDGKSAGKLGGKSSENASWSTGSCYWPVVAATALLIFSLWFSVSQMKKEDMSGYHFSEYYAKNVLELAGSNALVLTNWDPFTFPMIYYQWVEHKGKGVCFVDVEMLRRTWYIKMLRNWYPLLLETSKAEVDAFVSAVRPFEEGGTYDGQDLQAKYLAMVRSFIDRSAKSMPVYAAVFPLMRPLEKGITEGYFLEPYGVAYKVRARNERSALGDEQLTPLDYSRYDFPLDVKQDGGSIGLDDRMSKMIRNYYAMLFLSRATLVEKSDVKEAVKLYEKGIALEGDRGIAERARERLNVLK